MKTIILFVLIWIALCSFVYFLKVFVYGINSSPSDSSVSNRNFKVRFDSIKEKYYITNELLNGKDKDVTGIFGFRKYYTDKFKVELIVEKLNEK